MPGEIYITASSAICGRRVFKNEKIIFATGDADMVHPKLPLVGGDTNQGGHIFSTGDADSLHSKLPLVGGDTNHGRQIFATGEGDAPDFLLQTYQHLGVKYPKFYKMDNLSKLGWLATEILLKESFDAAAYQPEDVGVVLSNAASSLDADLKYFEHTKEYASPALFVYTLPNIVIGEICIKHKLKGENAFFIFEAFNADFIQKYVSGAINNNILQACICGWVEYTGEDYKAVLFLVEKNVKQQENFTLPENTYPVYFTSENLNKIYQSSNG